MTDPVEELPVTKHAIMPPGLKVGRIGKEKKRKNTELFHV